MLDLGPYSDRLLTRDEWQRVVNLKPFIHYTKEEKQFLYNLAQEFANPNLTADCLTCTGGGNAKLLLYGWFNDRKDALLEAIIEQEEKEKIAKELVKHEELPNYLELAEKQVEEYAAKTCVCGNELTGNQKKYCSKECRLNA